MGPMVDPGRLSPQQGQWRIVTNADCGQQGKWWVIIDKDHDEDNGESWPTKPIMRPMVDCSQRRLWPRRPKQGQQQIVADKAPDEAIDKAHDKANGRSLGLEGASIDIYVAEANVVSCRW
jgi:hypothetical protein